MRFLCSDCKCFFELFGIGFNQESNLPKCFVTASRISSIVTSRRCGVIFQSSKEKAEDTLAKVKNEIAGSIFLRALSPAICTAAKHAQLNPGTAKRQHYQGELTNVEWLVSQLRLPDILNETGVGARLICMPFAKAAVHGAGSTGEDTQSRIGSGGHSKDRQERTQYRCPFNA